MDGENGTKAAVAAENTQQEVQPAKGRAAAIERYRSMNPDTQDDPDDDTLHDFFGGRYSELEGKYNEQMRANSKLAELVSKDPKLGVFLSMIAGEESKSVPYALSRVFGKDALALEDGALEEFEAGYQEHLKELAESRKAQEQASANVESYKKSLAEFGQQHELSEDQLSEVHQGIMELSENVLTGNIPAELIDLVYKGLNYDKDVQEAADTGFVEGKNEVVSAKMKEKTAPDVVPDLNGGSKEAKKQERRTFQTEPGSVYDNLKEVK